jgi:uncharacterized OB-fold protein
MSEPLVIPGTITIPLSYAAGAAASRFLVALRDERRLLGTRCPSCNTVLVPARSFCAGCWNDTGDWIEVGPDGALVTWTTVHVPLPHLPPPPVTLGLLRLDGADTDLLHLIGGDPRRLARGLRLRPVWREGRSGSLLDIAHFEPIT